MSRPRVLMLTRLFPSSQWPALGTFCAERAKALASCAEVRVLAPVPWFPPIGTRGKWSRWARVERQSTTSEGVAVSYPRYVSLPKVAAFHQGLTMARCVRRELARHWGDWRPDVIDAHFAFPDGYAAAKLAEHLDCGLTVTCHGTDLLVYPGLMGVGSMIRRTLSRADRVIAVSPALKDRAVELGCPPDRAVFLPNAVDAEKFILADKVTARRQLSLPVQGRAAVCVGHLNRNKNQIVLLEAISAIRQAGRQAPCLILVGAGPMEGRLRAASRELGIAELVHFAGPRPHDQVPSWIAAGDWLVLASKNEGWPTVYFEAMACGRPVITSNVAAARAAITKPEYGLVVEPNSPRAFAEALQAASAKEFDPQPIRAYAQQHSWSRWAETFMGIVQEIRGAARTEGAK